MYGDTQMIKVIVDVPDNSIDKVVSMTLTNTAKHARALIDSDISTRLNLNNREVSARMSIDRVGTNVVSVSMDRRSLGLANYLAGVQDDGSVVSVLRGSLKKLKGSFVIKFKSGREGILQRTKGEIKNSRKAKKLRDNLYLLYGASASQVMESTLVNKDYIQRKVASTFAVEFERNFARLSNG